MRHRPPPRRTTMTSTPRPVTSPTMRLRRSVGQGLCRSVLINTVFMLDGVRNTATLRSEFRRLGFSAGSPRMICGLMSAGCGCSTQLMRVLSAMQAEAEEEEAAAGEDDEEDEDDEEVEDEEADAAVEEEEMDDADMEVRPWWG